MSYDVIIVGGGTAGCAAARRLSGAPDVNVLLLESGPDSRPPELSSPARWPEMLGGSLDYGYRTIRQPAALDRVIDWPRGRVLGGTSTMNAMIFIRPTEDDLAQWPEGWRFSDMRPVFDAIESRRDSLSAALGPRLRSEAGVPDCRSRRHTAAVRLQPRFPRSFRRWCGRSGRRHGCRRTRSW